MSDLTIHNNRQLETDRPIAFFIDTFQNIGTFFYNYNPHRGDVIISTDRKFIKGFLNQCFPDASVIYLPEGMTMISGNRSFDVPGAFKTAKEKLITSQPQLDKLAARLPKRALAIWSAPCGIMHFYALFRLMGRLEIDRVFLWHQWMNSVVIAHWWDRNEIVAQNKEMSGFLADLDDHLGIETTLVDNEVPFTQSKWFLRTVGVSLRDMEPSRTLDLPDWSEITMRYRERLRRFWFLADTDRTDRILIIDSPIIGLPGVDADATGKNVATWLNRLISKETMVHWKGHYRVQAAGASVARRLDRNVIEIDPDIPVEFIMDEYSMIFLFSSTAVLRNCEANVYCMLNLVKFLDEDTRVRMTGPWQALTTVRQQPVIMLHENGEMELA